MSGEGGRWVGRGRRVVVVGEGTDSGEGYTVVILVCNLVGPIFEFCLSPFELPRRSSAQRREQR